MAETVYLSDGSMEVILGDKGDFLERLLRERLGDDVARCFTEYAEELHRIQDAANEHERTADGYYQMCTDAIEAFTRILGLLNQPRLNRAALQRVVQQAHDDLNSNL